MRMAAVLILALVPTHIFAQMQRSPFTSDELLKAYRLLLPEAEARQLALASESHDETPAPTRYGALRFQPIPNSQLSDDTLVLLSLLSEATASKVRTYRTRLWGGSIPPDEETRWRKRVEELRELVAAEDPPLGES